MMSKRYLKNYLKYGSREGGGRDPLAAGDLMLGGGRDPLTAGTLVQAECVQGG